MSVKEEVENYFVFEKISSGFDIKVYNLEIEEKNESEAIAKKYDIQKADAEALVLSKRLKTMLLTDDWDLRETANIYEIEVHGTIGVLFKAYTKKIVKKNELEKALKSIPQRSSLYISSKIIEECLSFLRK